MKSMVARNEDLNLLIALDALLQVGSVSGAAARVGRSTPAMSHALGRLRRRLKDPILVRSGQRMVPTPRAESLREPVHALVSAARTMLGPAAAFDSATADRELRIRASDYVLSTLGTELDRRITAQAPGIRLRFSPNAPEDPEDVREGTIDLAIGVYRNLPPECRIQTLFEERLVCAIRRDHPVIRSRLTLSQYTELPHIQIAPRGRPGGLVDQLLAREGKERRVARAVPFFLAGLQLVSQTDYLLTVPERLAQAWAERLQLRVLEPPLAFTPYAIVQLWHPRHEADAGHRFLRRHVMEAARATRPRKRRRT